MLFVYSRAVVSSCEFYAKWARRDPFFLSKTMSIDAKAIEHRAEELATPILANLGYGIVASEFCFEEGRWLLRVYIDKEGGVTIADCVRASHSIEDIILVEDFIPVSYNLEVSSPGIFRPLRSRGDFEKYVGQRARIKTLEPVDGRSNFRGIIAGFEQGSVAISIDGTKFLVPMEKIGKAKLDPEEIMPGKGERRISG